MNLAELQERQSWPLSQKIDHALATIDGFVGRLGEDGVYLSFSGGKDSTVMLDLARRIYPNILSVFINTGNEWPDVVKFVRQKQEEGANIQELHPKMTPKEVWAKYGFPLVSKEHSKKIHYIRYNPNSKSAKKWLTGRSIWTLSQRWRYLIDEPYETSWYCCQALKKDVAHRFEKQTGRRPIIGVMADESLSRRGQYLHNGGCTVWGEKPYCRPLSIWTEEDVWEYIKQNNIAIADIYHKGVTRTGCVGCGFGAFFPGDPRFQQLLQNYPKYYEMVMNYTNSGYTYREALRKMLAVTGQTLPDETPAGIITDTNE